jgi:hypothetical protein
MPVGGGSGAAIASAVVRVMRHSATGQEAVCVDALAPGFVLARLEGLGRDSLLSLEPSDEPLSAGRCAGPTALDLVRALAPARLDLSRLSAHAIRANLSGRRRLTAGPYAVEVVSTLHARLSRPRRNRESTDSGSSGLGDFEGPDLQTVEIDYRIVRLTGHVRARFAGLPAGCDLLDSCGLAGELDYAVNIRRGELTVFASRPRPARRSGAADFLRALRRGELGVEFSGELPDSARGRVTAGEVRDGAPVCDDSTPVTAPDLRLSEAGRHLRIGLALDTGLDAFRTHCAGPSLAAITAGRSPASVAVRPADLLRRRVVLRLRGNGRFARLGYGGTTSSDIAVELRRTKLRVDPRSPS